MRPNTDRGPNRGSPVSMYLHGFYTWFQCEVYLVTLFWFKLISKLHLKASIETLSLELDDVQVLSLSIYNLGRED